jgi:glycosyltransferase involved in cell wall biosynthesis
VRILIVNWSLRKIAGTEDYLNELFPALHDLRYEIAFAHEVDEPRDRPRMDLPAGTHCWDLSILGVKRTLDAMKAWQPDLIYAHGQLNSEFEARFTELAPAIYFAHNYYGTCISGLKTFKFPIIQPCNRRFGSACLFHYFPHRCGGLSPVTMFQRFREESKRSTILKQYAVIVTHSTHMRNEYIAHGFSPAQVRAFSYGPEKPARAVLDAGSRDQQQPARLIFVGRMEELKGGQTLLEALPLIVRDMDRPVHLTFAGDGPARNDWEQRAIHLQRHDSNLSIEFAGWVDKTQLENYYAASDLLVVPSLWPEPFGRIGPDAGRYGLPVAAFAVGGITDWLIDGKNGFLAPGNPPTAPGLARAILKCLSDPLRYVQLRVGARQIAQRFTMKAHLKTLTKIFDETARKEPVR